ncbi:hypothetical protein [Granulicella arctica]|uniref:N-acyl-D-aspartate/D-glutamate deacylase n=1 Tax=Granulicella arctica TaxID=940613 RepID=A0A7Y9PFK9_9BACT|nr:hypothetical protein [Granulicella arctica]NYF78887.1 N-acyl-D-aspartate/D-glutamate deacylase [Granulicella arctica]
MPSRDLLIRNARVLDGSGSAAMDVAIRQDRICEIGPSPKYSANVAVDAQGHVLASGCIDVHTHDDTSVIRSPAMLPKRSQGAFCLAAKSNQVATTLNF